MDLLLLLLLLQPVAVRATRTILWLLLLGWLGGLVTGRGDAPSPLEEEVPSVAARGHRPPRPLVLMETLHHDAGLVMAHHCSGCAAVIEVLRHTKSAVRVHHLHPVVLLPLMLLVEHQLLLHERLLVLKLEQLLLCSGGHEATVVGLGERGRRGDLGRRAATCPGIYGACVRRG